MVVESALAPSAPWGRLPRFAGEGKVFQTGSQPKTEVVAPVS